MNIMITARHFNLTASLKSRIEQKLRKLEKFSDNLMEAHMIIEQMERRSLVELILHSRTADFHARADSYGRRLAIDNAIRKMKTQLKAHREKLKEHKQKG
jgi:putative sigma-54 modulation protein